jgi:methylated-DNA-[protein]-cysteine S-methyltransferase
VTTIVHDSPVGLLTLTSEAGALTGIRFASGEDHDVPPIEGGSDSVLDLVRRELDLYFAGRLTSFSVAVAPRGTTFQRRVWTALGTIPYGETRSYGSIAWQIGAQHAVRAVGAANGANPIPIVIPCHRVIGADGSLTGFGGGLHRKRFLLDLEQGVHALL